MTASSRLHLLWDASALISYYLVENAATKVTAPRVSNLVEAIRHHRLDAISYIPNIVVAEVFAAFDRHYYSTWEPQIYKRYGGKGKSLHGKRYASIRAKFRRDIHNGALFYQYELNRYHILALDLISPVDKHRKFYRKGSVRSMGASDLLVGAMGLHLVRLHGSESVALITTDRRMEAIFGRACPRVRPKTAQDLGLTSAAKNLGFGPWNAGIYPKVIDIARCSETLLEKSFGQWPLPTTKPRNRAPKA